MSACAQWLNFNLSGNLNSRPAAFHLMKQDIKYVPAAGGDRGWKVSTAIRLLRSTPCIYYVPTLQPPPHQHCLLVACFPRSVCICVCVCMCVWVKCSWSFHVIIVNLPFSHLTWLWKSLSWVWVKYLAVRLVAVKFQLLAKTLLLWYKISQVLIAWLLASLIWGVYWMWLWVRYIWT